MSDSKQTFSMGLHLPGLLSILGEHLYSDSRVAIREALQNAHDSCRRRLVEDGDHFEPAVRLSAIPEEAVIEIRDNGSGLTRAEVQQFLATIGRSYTGELKDQLSFTDVEQAAELIGQFGLGLLSGFLLAKQLVLTTRSYQPGEPALRWTSDGGQEYTLEEVEDHPIGTSLRLELKASAQFLLEEEELRRTAQGYVEFLPLPIYVSDDPAPLNSDEPPWHRDADHHEYVAFVEERFGMPPLTVLPLRDQSVPVGRSHKTVSLSGFLFVPPASVASLHEHGEVAVYLRRMFLTAQERDLLPAWARFVRGVVESPQLRPTVSREALRQDDLYAEVQRCLSDQLLLHFRDLALNEPEVWREIVVAHNDLIKGWALQEEALFDAVDDLVHFETSRGRLRLPEIQAINQGVVYYFSDESSSNQEKLLYEARGWTVIDASRFAEEAFLERYSRRHPDVQIEQLGPHTEHLFEDADPARLKSVAQYYASKGVATRTVAFEPESLPAMLVFPPAHDQIRRVRNVVDSGSLAGPFAELMRDFLDRRQQGRELAEPVLHLNVRSPLLGELEQTADAATFRPALDLVLESARFFAGKDMTPDESLRAFERAMQSLGTLLDVRGAD